MCECYEYGDGVEVARDERYREHTGGIEVRRWARAVSMQAHIKWGWTNKQSSEQGIGGAVSRLYDYNNYL